MVELYDDVYGLGCLIFIGYFVPVYHDATISDIRFHGLRVSTKLLNVRPVKYLTSVTFTIILQPGKQSFKHDVRYSSV
jgi:hypothetical protein